MASSPLALKQWSLSKNKSINSFKNWRQNPVYTLSLNSNFALFLAGEHHLGKEETESKFPGAYAQANCQLLSSNISEYLSEEFNLYPVCLEHDAHTFWLPNYRCSLSGFC